MAYIIKIVCPKCLLPKDIYVSPGRENQKLCDDCTQKQKTDDKAFHLYKLSKLSVEQRLAAIEEQLYDWMEYNNENNNGFDINKVIG